MDTRDLEHARELAERGARAGETVVVLSGDGLIGVVADVLRDFPGAVLGVLPGRSRQRSRACARNPQGSDRGLRGYRPRRPARDSDLGDGGLQDEAFVGIASVGFDSDANRIANDAPAWLGRLVYAYGALRALFVLASGAL